MGREGADGRAFLLGDEAEVSALALLLARFLGLLPGLVDEGFLGLLPLEVGCLSSLLALVLRLELGRGREIVAVLLCFCDALVLSNVLLLRRVLRGLGTFVLLLFGLLPGLVDNLFQLLVFLFLCLARVQCFFSP